MALNSIIAEDKQANVTTPNGSIVMAWIGNDTISESRKQAAIDEVKACYPNIEIISEATHAYNCHGYAWCMTEGGPTRLIYTDVYKYMNDGSYTEVLDKTGPLKVFYANASSADEHSAVVTDDSGKFISKWADYPLIRHAPEDCWYYAGATLRYFVKTSLMTIEGSQTILDNQTATYRLSYKPAGNIVWSVTSNMQIISGQGTDAIVVKGIGSDRGSITASMTHVFEGRSVTTRATRGVTVGIPDENLIDVTIGGQSSNYTLFVYHSGRNDCRANYRGTGGNNSILEYEWEANGFEVFNAQTSNNSVVYLRATSTSIGSPTTISLRARNNVGWSSKRLIGANVNSSSGYSILTSSDGIITIEPNEGREYSLLRPTERTLSGSMPYEVYNSYTGVQVANGAVSREGSTINLSHLPTGIYVFSLRVSDDLRQTLQISIRH